jgi:hypothetical protein
MNGTQLFFVEENLLDEQMVLGHPMREFRPFSHKKNSGDSLIIVLTIRVCCQGLNKKIPNQEKYRYHFRFY